MAQYRAEIRSARGVTTRLGQKTRGLEVVLNGWRQGVKVRAFYQDGCDVFEIETTGGSLNVGRIVFVAVINENMNEYGGRE